MTKLLEFKNITFQWQKSQTLFDNMNFSIPQGKATVLLGPNGAGKSTIMDLVLGWRQPQQGEIFLDGKNLNDYSPKAKGQFMSLVPQDEAIHFDYSVMEYILLGRAPYLPSLGEPGQADYEIARDVLEEVGISKLENRNVSLLSGGERQLVLLARALVQQPQLLLLDEPTSHLDFYNREQIMQILERLLDKGMSIFFTSHNPDLVNRLSAHAILLRQGKVIHSGPEKEVITEENLKELYNLDVKIAQVDGRRIFLWG